MLTLGTGRHGPMSVLSGVEHATRLAGYSVSVVRTDEAVLESLQPAVDALVGEGVEVIIISEPAAQELGNQQAHLGGAACAGAEAAGSALADSARATLWADGLNVHDAEVLVPTRWRGSAAEARSGSGRSRGGRPCHRVRRLGRRMTADERWCVRRCLKAAAAR